MSDVVFELYAAYIVFQELCHFYYCRNFVDCHPVFIVHYRKVATMGYMVNPFNVVCVNALPHKNLIVKVG